MEEKETIYALFQKYIEGSIGRDELAQLAQYVESEGNKAYWQALLEAYYSGDERSTKDPLWEKATPMVREVWQRLQPQMARESTYQLPRKSLLTKMYPYAAAIGLLLFIGGIGHYYLSKVDKPVRTSVVKEDIQPGGNRATLRLSDGTSMALSEAQTGVVVNEGGITYTDGTAIIQTAATQMVTLTTPRAGQYQVTLPDGTKVWLNAATKLRYPTSFTGEERRVELEGEAYFEVQKSAIPFRVQSPSQRIEVLGTQFNVMAYTDESESQTTLVEGSVRLTPIKGAFTDAGILLKPGEQVVLDASGRGVVKPVHVDDYVAWKNGLIVLERQSIPEVLRQLERWYDIEFIFEKGTPLPTKTLSGEVLRDLPLSALLTALEEQTHLKFKRKGRRIMVMD